MPNNGQDPTCLIPMEGIENLRDLGGLPTLDGRTVKPGALYRSATLTKATTADSLALARMGIKTIADVRGAADFKQNPDRLPPDGSTRLISIPIINGRIESLIPQLQEIGEDEDRDGSPWMIRIYQSFPRDFQEQTARFLRLIADPTHHPLLVHCTAGKDRTGFLVALVLALVGVPMSHIQGDYLLSNEGFEDPLSHLAHTGLADRIIWSIVEARVEYLRSSFDVIERDYGGVSQYTSGTLGLTAGEVEALQSTLLS